MKHYKILLLLICLIAYTNSIQAQALHGGAGICHVSGDPDLNGSLQTQLEKDDCHFAYDRDAKKLYCYDPAYPAGSRWNEYQEPRDGIVLKVCGQPAKPISNNCLVIDTCASPVSLYYNDGTTYSQTETGPQGPPGPAGADGSNGSNGVDGSPGAQGPAGADGPPGIQGPQGIQGPTGAMGANGPPGPAGANGSNGTNGSDGADGTNGVDGAPGLQGPPGIQGPAGVCMPCDSTITGGVAGPPGPQGPPGIQGPVGADGLDGSDGQNGTNGTNGAQGPAGPQGPTGSQGTQGPAGPAGIQGPQGPIGPPGIVTDTNGVQVITGPQGPPGPQGPAGADGAQGPPGLQGNQGTTGAQGIPGINGVNGADGADGQTGATGPQGPQGPIGPAGADAVPCSGVTIPPPDTIITYTTITIVTSVLQGDCSVMKVSDCKNIGVQDIEYNFCTVKSDTINVAAGQTITIGTGVINEEGTYKLLINECFSSIDSSLVSVDTFEVFCLSCLNMGGTQDIEILTDTLNGFAITYYVTTAGDTINSDHVFLCDLVKAGQLAPCSPQLVGLDCDCGGIEDLIECATANGNPQNPADDCQSAIDAGMDICAIIAADPMSPLATADCDGGGVDNLTECTKTPICDPTDSADDCYAFLANGGDLCSAQGLQLYGNLDKDGGGITNANECAAGADPSNPSDDQCISIIQQGLDICAEIAAGNTVLAGVDCDGDGQSNGDECNQGTDPNDPCDNTLTAAEFCALVAANPSLGSLDCDGGGVDNVTECSTGENPLDPTDDCQSAIDSGMDICAELMANPSSPLALLDCDNGGIDNITECNNGNDPSDPIDDVVAQSSDLSIIKSFTNPTVTVGQNTTFTLTANNLGSDLEPNAVVTDTFPVGLTYVSNTCGATFSGGILTWTIGALGAGSSATCNVTVTVDQSGLITNIASISGTNNDPNNSNNDNADSITGNDAPVEEADLFITKNFLLDTVPIGSNSSFALGLLNQGPDAAINVVVRDTFPIGITYVSNNCGAIYNPSTRELVWSFPSVAANQSVFCGVVYTADQEGEIVNSTTISSDTPDSDPTNNLVSDTLFVPESVELCCEVDPVKAVLIDWKNTNLQVRHISYPDNIISGYTLDVNGVPIPETSSVYTNPSFEQYESTHSPFTDGGYDLNQHVPDCGSGQGVFSETNVDFTDGGFVNYGSYVLKIGTANSDNHVYIDDVTISNANVCGEDMLDVTIKYRYWTQGSAVSIVSGQYCVDGVCNPAANIVTAASGLTPFNNSIATIPRQTGTHSVRVEGTLSNGCTVFYETEFEVTCTEP